MKNRLIMNEGQITINSLGNLQGATIRINGVDPFASVTRRDFTAVQSDEDAMPCCLGGRRYNATGEISPWTRCRECPCCYDICELHAPVITEIAPPLITPVSELQERRERRDERKKARTMNSMYATRSGVNK